MCCTGEDCQQLSSWEASLQKLLYRRAFSSSEHWQKSKNLCYERQAVLFGGYYCTHLSSSQVPTTNNIERFWLQGTQSDWHPLGNHCTSCLGVWGKDDDVWGWIHGESKPLNCKYLITRGVLTCMLTCIRCHIFELFREGLLVYVTSWAKTRHIPHFMKIEIRPEISSYIIV